MPKLPDVGALGQRSPIQQRRGFAQQDTEGPARAMAAAGGMTKVAEGIVDDMDRKQAVQEVFSARRQLNEWEQANIHGEGGAASKTGKDAFDLPEKLPKSLDETITKISEGLTTRRSKEAFQNMAISRRQEVGEWAGKYAGQQRKVFEQVEFESDIDSMRDRAVRIASEPADGTPEGAAKQAATVKAEIAIGQQRIIGHMKDRGMPDAAIGEATKAFASKAHAGVVSSLLVNGDVERAQSYLSANEASMDSRDVLKVKGETREMLTRQRAQAFGDGIEADLEAGKVTLGQALDKAREQFPAGSPERDAAVLQVKQRVSELEAGKAQAAKATSDEAWKILTNGGSRKSIPPAVWNALPGEEQRQINDYVESKWRRAKADAEGKKEDDWGGYMALRDMAREDPERFSDPQTLLRAEPRMSKQQMNSLIGLRDTIAKDDIKAMQSQRTVKRTIDLVKSDIQAAGVDLTPKEGTSKAKDTAQFFGTLTQALDAATAEKGKPLTDEEASRIGRGMLRDVVEQGSGIGGFFQTKKKAFQTDQAKTYVVKPFAEIPVEHRRGFTEALAKRKNLTRSMYGDRDYQLSAEDKAEIERLYTLGVNSGKLK